MIYSLSIKSLFSNQISNLLIKLNIIKWNDNWKKWNMRTKFKHW